MKEMMSVAIVPTAKGIAVLFTTSTGLALITDATMMTTAETGEIARTRFEVNCIGNATIIGSTCACSAIGGMISMNE